jgi:hypothetical protein
MRSRPLQRLITPTGTALQHCYHNIRRLLPKMPRAASRPRSAGALPPRVAAPRVALQGRKAVALLRRLLIRRLWPCAPASARRQVTAMLADGTSQAQNTSQSQNNAKQLVVPATAAGAHRHSRPCWGWAPGARRRSRPARRTARARARHTGHARARRTAAAAPHGTPARHRTPARTYARSLPAGPSAAAAAPTVWPWRCERALCRRRRLTCCGA